jgi:hypothetical protein
MGLLTYQYVDVRVHESVYFNPVPDPFQQLTLLKQNVPFWTVGKTYRDCVSRDEYFLQCCGSGMFIPGPGS